MSSRALLVCPLGVRQRRRVSRDRRCAPGGNVLPSSRGAPLPRRSSDLSHNVDDCEVRVVMITTVSPSPTCWAFSLSVLQGAAMPRLRTRQCPLLWGRAIPRCIAVVTPTQERQRDGRQCLGVGPWRSTREGNTHRQSLWIGQTVLFVSAQTLRIKGGLTQTTTPHLTRQRREKNIVRKNTLQSTALDNSRGGISFIARRHHHCLNCEDVMRQPPPLKDGRVVMTANYGLLWGAERM